MRRGLSAGELIRQLVDRAEDDELLEAMNADFAAVAVDPAAREESAAERRAWEATLADGLPAQR